MEFFRIHKTIPFMHYSHILNAISLVSFIIAVFWIFYHGLALSIEFTGGTQVVVQYPEAVQTEQIREQIQSKLGVEAAVQNYGTARDIMIRLPMKEGESSGQMAGELLKALQETAPGVKMLNNEFVGPQVGEELATDGLTALLLVVADAIRVEVCYCRHHRQPPRHRDCGGHLCRDELGVFAAGSGGCAGSARLFRERISDYFRPCARALPQDAPHGYG